MHASFLKKICVVVFFLKSTFLLSTELHSQNPNCSPYIVLIGGGSGSGKTSLATLISSDDQLKNNITLISVDDYYTDVSHLSRVERSKLNYDHPDAIDVTQLHKDLLQIQQGHNIAKLNYNPVTGKRITNGSLSCNKIVLVEGIFTLVLKDIVQLSQLKIFVETDDDIRFIRRVKRDLVKTDKSFEELANQYHQSIKPMHESFIAPSKAQADLILNGNKPLDIGVNAINLLLSSKIKSI